MYLMTSSSKTQQFAIRSNFGRGFLETCRTGYFQCTASPVAKVSATMDENVFEATIVNEAITAHVPMYTNTDRSPYFLPMESRNPRSTTKVRAYARNWGVKIRSSHMVGPFNTIVALGA